MNGITFSFAQQADEPLIRELLIRAGLPEEDIGAHLTHFITARAGGMLVGCVGLELARENALLRSLAVAPDFRSRGLGKELCRRITDYARERGYQALYLLTTSAADYFHAHGYRKVDRSEVPEGISKSAQFQSLCPSSAVLMKISL